MHGYNTVQIDWGERPESSESQLLAIECSEMSKRRAPSKDGDGVHPNVSMGARKASSEGRLFVIERSKRAKGKLRA